MLLSPPYLEGSFPHRSHETSRKSLENVPRRAGWKQFHDPKNLAAALGIEAAELNEVFLWKSTEESHDVDVTRVREELADVLAYALLLADAFGLDPEEIVLEKVAANAKKYPVEKARGVATKYTDL